jgi:ABC-type glycerol-3-phosphate transport system substrate-binding protein
MLKKTSLLAITLAFTLITAAGCRSKNKPEADKPPPVITPTQENDGEIRFNPDVPEEPVDPNKEFLEDLFGEEQNANSDEPAPQRDLKDAGDLSGLITEEDQEITIWSYQDGRNTFGYLLDVLESKYPNLSIEFKTFSSEQSLWNELLIASRTDSLPDIYSIKNSWVYRFTPLITPLPSELNERVNLQADFLPIAEEAFLKDNKVLAIPLFVDSLALMINTDLLADDRITLGDNPDRNWESFIENAEDFREIYDDDLKFIALGWQESAPLTAKLFQSLLLQSGLSPETKLPGKQSANEALGFLTRFNLKSSTIFSWPERASSDLEEFLDGELAILLVNNERYRDITELLLPTNRQRERITIRPEAIELISLPQPKEQELVIAGEAWGYTVSTNSEKPQTAWAVILELTSEKNSYELSLKTGKTPARLDLRSDFFAKNALFARSAGIWDHLDFPEVFAQNYQQLIESENELEKIQTRRYQTEEQRQEALAEFAKTEEFTTNDALKNFAQFFQEKYDQ